MDVALPPHPSLLPPFSPTAIHFCLTRHNKIFLYIPLLPCLSGGGMFVLGTHRAAALPLPGRDMEREIHFSNPGEMRL